MQIIKWNPYNIWPPKQPVAALDYHRAVAMKVEVGANKNWGKLQKILIVLLRAMLAFSRTGLSWRSFLCDAFRLIFLSFPFVKATNLVFLYFYFGFGCRSHCWLPVCLGLGHRCTWMVFTKYLNFAVISCEPTYRMNESEQCVLTFN